MLDNKDYKDDENAFRSSSFSDNREQGKENEDVKSTENPEEMENLKETDVKETNSEDSYTQNYINRLDVHSLEEQSDENVDNSDSESQNGQNPYGQNQGGYNQNPYGQNQGGYNPNPYGQNQGEYNPNPYGYYENPYFSDENSNEPEIPPPQKGKWGFWIIAAVMVVVSVISAVVLADRFGNGTGAIENSSADLPSHEYTSKVIEHVKTEEPKEEIYTDKIELYEDSQKSCVTVITKVKSNFYGQVTESKALGSGFVISKDGYIVTNAHVVEGGTDFKVRFYDGKEVDALLIGKETYCDIAVIKIRSSEDLVPVSFGDSGKVRIGDYAMAIGTPSSEELFGTMTFGVISGKERKIPMTNSAGQTVRTMYLLQTDATLNPGNSGGPLFNMYGQVIGINTMKLMDEYEGIGFAIPSSGAVKIINSLISTGEADYTDSEYVKGGSQIGIKGLTLTDDAKKEYGFSEEAPDGVLIVSIEKKSSAYKAGLSGYDVICEFNGKTIKTIEQLIEEIQNCHPGDKVTVKVYRVERDSKKGEYHTYNFALDAVEE
ncbi:MAG: trypsin-like peptidase domain-containing protein [Clostridia bacterium]|nr:trypsin-like peptidase domain-containing protein [Clostridia bacterium]